MDHQPPWQLELLPSLSERATLPLSYVPLSLLVVCALLFSPLPSSSLLLRSAVVLPVAFVIFSVPLLSTLGRGPAFDTYHAAQNIYLFAFLIDRFFVVEDLEGSFVRRGRGEKRAPRFGWETVGRRAVWSAQMLVCLRRSSLWKDGEEEEQAQDQKVEANGTRENGPTTSQTTPSPPPLSQLRILQNGTTTSKTAASPPPPSKLRFLLSQLLTTTLIFISVDVLYNYFIPTQPYLTGQGPFPSSFAGVVLTGLWGANMVFQGVMLMFPLVNIFCVGSGLLEVEHCQPALFGSVAHSYTLRGYWSKTWYVPFFPRPPNAPARKARTLHSNFQPAKTLPVHAFHRHQLYRRLYTLPSQFLSRSPLLSRHPPLLRFLSLLSAFLLSGLQHWYIAYATYRSGKGTFLFFLIQVAGLLVEEGVLVFLSGWGWKIGKRARAVGYAGVLVWLSVTSNLFFHEVVEVCFFLCFVFVVKFGRAD